MEAILEVRNLRKYFGKLRAVDDVSLTVKPGAITGLIGPNGSGKSTLFNVITGVEQKEGGQVFFEGRELGNLSPHEIFRLGLVRSFQDPRLFFGMTVLDNAMVPPKYQRGEHLSVAPFHSRWATQESSIAEHIAGELESLELVEHYERLASELSGGQTKLLEIGRPMSAQPKTLLLDEPTAGVAPILARRIFEQICELRKRSGVSFFIIEHRLDVLFDFVDDVYVMNQGRILSHGKPDEIVRDARVIDAYLGG